MTRDTIIENGGNHRATEIEPVELDAVLKRFKRRKAPGPDERAIEFFKELSQENTEQLLELLNEWWQAENMDWHRTACEVELDG